jgi:tellurite methyltransferase
MALNDQLKWDNLHGGRHAADKPSALLEIIFQQFGSILSPGRALDIASGRGRNSIFLAARGWAVEAMDISAVALAATKKRAEEKGLSITVTNADLDYADLSDAAYDLILNFNFLQRSLVPKMKRALKVGGLVIFETFLIDQQALGHPKNPAYLLQHNELLEWFRDFRVLSYQEGKFTEAGTEVYKAGLLAQKLG